MQKLSTLIIFITFIFGAHATILTVNNNNTAPGQYASLQAAIDAAVAGDTLLIHRSSTSYGNAILKKKLTLIAEGVMPNKMNTNLFCEVNNVEFTYDATSNASGSNVIGLKILYVYLREKNAGSTEGVDDISLTNNRIYFVSLTKVHKNLSLKKNIISILNGGTLKTAIITNNFFNTIDMLNTDNLNVVFSNNIVFERFTARNAVVINNVFTRDIVGSSFSFTLLNCMFTNNIVQSTVPVDVSIFAQNGNVSVDNHINLNPQFVYPVLYNTIYGYTLTSPATGPFANFHLQVGSPGIGAGLDGTDIGIYGGTTPWRDGSTTDSRYRYYPLPDAIPVITNVSVLTPVVNSGGTLQLQLNATTQP